jgi:hypothetical protein
MKRILLFAALFTCLVTEAGAQTPKLDWVNKVGAKQFPAGKKIYKVKAISDTSKLLRKQYRLLLMNVQKKVEAL